LYSFIKLAIEEGLIEENIMGLFFGKVSIGFSRGDGPRPLF